uniref:F-box domain-containing protein n=1 Tax=Bionectria ochroleuca TaxID=29856 RepID=A0A8H7K4T3_BIOOC
MTGLPIVSRTTEGQRLPNELLMHVMSFLEPGKGQFLGASHETTKTLMALMRVCKSANTAASPIFARHCVFLDSEDRTLRFARCLAVAASVPEPAHQSPFRSVSDIFMESFLEFKTENLETLAVVQKEIEDDNADDEEDENSSSDYVPVPRPHPELKDLPVAVAVRDIFLAVAPTLKRLIINIPLRSLWPEDDELGVRALLRSGFEALINLEEFVSVQDELFLITSKELPSDEVEVWAKYWPNLRRLYLYDKFLEDSFWQDVMGCPQLNSVTLGRPDGNHVSEPADIKRDWISTLAGHRVGGNVYWGPIRPLTVIIFDMDGEHCSITGFNPSWETLDPDERIRIRYAKAPNSGIPKDEASPRDSVHVWVRKHAFAGMLWSETAIQAYNPLSRDG